jgi:hypothetical protein
VAQKAAQSKDEAVESMIGLSSMKNLISKWCLPEAQEIEQEK